MEFLQGLTYKWKLNKISKYEISKLSSDLNILPPIASVLYSRGFTDKKSAMDFLFPFYDPKIYHSSGLHGANETIERILVAIKKQQKILICGDYDVDGITATSLMLYGLLNCGANVNFFLPHRLKDGYGLSVKTIDRALKSKYDLLITVDNGTSAFDALLYAKENNIDVIVTDHHQPKEIPSGALYIVNPHQPACKYPFKELAGVGVAFKIIQLLYERLNKKIESKIYELFLLGTIADVVPLIDENRYLVNQALINLSNNESIALSLLKSNAKITSEQPLTSTDIAFSIAPQINALGRLEDPRDGVLFLIDSDKEKLEKIGMHLFQVNQSRRKIEKEIFEKLKEEIEKENIDPQVDGCIVRANKSFPAGIIGLIAARLCHLYGVPTCVFHEMDDGTLKGSCRSINEFNIFEGLSSIDQSLMISYGGHAMAAGISLYKENLTAFTKALSKSIHNTCTKEDLQQKILIDGVLEIEDINNKLWHDLKLLEPFGASNAVPMFYIENAYFKDISLLKDLHLKATIESDKGSIPIIFFNKPDFFNIIKENKNSKFEIVAKITQNNWNNKSKIELIGIDIKIST
jgi:single-stranded-DNA-specific exonuclease